LHDFASIFAKLFFSSLIFNILHKANEKRTCFHETFVIARSFCPRGGGVFRIIFAVALDKIFSL